MTLLARHTYDQVRAARNAIDSIKAVLGERLNAWPDGDDDSPLPTEIARMLHVLSMDLDTAATVLRRASRVGKL